MIDARICAVLIVLAFSAGVGISILEAWLRRKAAKPKEEA
jgi:hypothetical protein